MDYRRANTSYSGLFVGCLFFLTIAVTPGRQQDNFYFDPAPRDQSAVEGTTVRLRCDVSDRRHIAFYWSLGDKQRRLGNGSRRYQDDSDLVIHRVDRRLDAGPFKCVATNVTTGVSRVSAEAQINILWIGKNVSVQLRQPKAAWEVEAGVELSLKCHAEGNPEPSYEWYRNKIRLFSNEKIRFHRNRVKFLDIGAVDNGVYSCRAKNSAGERNSLQTFLLNILDVSTAQLQSSTFTRRLLVKADGMAWLHCHYDNAIITEWYYHESRLTNTSRTTVYPNGTLVISRVQRSDAGDYRCIGISQSGPAQTFASELLLAYINPLQASSFEPKPPPNNQPKVVPISHSYKVRCFTPDGLPQPTQRWLSPEGDVIPPGSGRITTDHEVLSIRNALPDDTGNYSCVSSNLAGQVSRSLWIVISEPPVISQPPISTRVEEEGTATFSCRMDGTPFPVSLITWKREDKPIKALHSRFVVDPQRGSLTIRRVQLSDDDNYACIVNTTGHAPVTSSNAHLYVKKKLKFRPPPVNARLELGSVARVYCSADGEDTPAVRWVRGPNPRAAPNLPPHAAIIERGTLVFDRVRPTDAGVYTCVATSGQGSINKTIELEVVVKPHFKVKPVNTTAHEGHPLTLHCLAEGDPKPTIQWDKDSKANNLDRERFKVLRNGSLYVSEVYMEDMGFYGCTAGNSGGFEREEIYLQVNSGQAFSGELTASDTFNLMKTITIAVCSAVAYLAIVIGLTVYCSVRLMRAKNQRKRHLATADHNQGEKFENGGVPTEHTELMEQRERDSSVLKGSGGCGSGGCGSGGAGSGGGVGGDDTRSHLSGVSSSHPSQSTHSARSRSAYDRLSFPRHDLQTIRVLGKGHYGDVFLAKAHGICDGEVETVVVVKSLLARDDVYVRDFRHEIDMYSHVRHANVARLLGICCQMEPQFLISEYTDWGDLKQYLWASRDDTAALPPASPPPPLTSPQIASVCRQVALGLAHLGESRLVHGDVATRNVLLTSRLDVKLCAAGPVRDGPYARDYPTVGGYPAPLRWLAPETARRGERSPRSDVWAYGVLVWELLTSADLPYADQSDADVLRLVCGPPPASLHLDTPDSAAGHQVAWTLVCQCTADAPQERPTFTQIIATIGDAAADSGV